MAATTLVNLDHLLATPIYDPHRCSIGFHPLHGLLPISIYITLCFFKKTRYLGIGLVTNMALDAINCQLVHGVWFVSM